MPEHLRVDGEIGRIGRSGDQAGEDIAENLVGAERDAGDRERLVHTRDGPVRAAEGADLALLVNVLERADDGGDVGLWIVLMDEPEVDVIDAQTLQALIDIAADRCGIDPALGGPHDRVGALGDEEELIAVAAGLEPLADNPLAPAGL